MLGFFGVRVLIGINPGNIPRISGALLDFERVLRHLRMDSMFGTV
ncbi:MAG TPA: hypothetical protein VHU89_08110 [Acidobacteriaceae bacterium]|nr:hypothetical protein [Acidobacteriaceae bacterium]